ncbi:MAG: class A beta-lactamase [Candidatus Eremiobacteraeota bacterium]|nr:class A beta-lactamase [Candidatus Eremiobacteraeota bacterium]
MDRSAFLLSLAAAGATTQHALAFGDAPQPFTAEEQRGRGRLGVTAVDLRDGRRIAQRGHERFPLASTFKLPLVMDVLTRVDRGSVRLDAKVAFRASEILAYSPSFGPAPHAGTKTVAELCEAAIEHSDNTAANLLLRITGGPPGVTAYLRALGDSVTRLDHTEPALNRDAPGDVRDTTTPEAMANLLARLVRDPILSPASKARLFEWLRRADTGQTRIRAGVPRDWTVGDKTGTTATGGNDVAILWPPHNRAPIVLAIYFAEVHGTDEARDAAIAAVARRVIPMFRS